MFRKLVEKAESAALKKAIAANRFTCPSCGAKPATPPASPDAAITCAQCGTTASLHEWSAAANGGTLVGHPDRPPAHTRITRDADASGTITWHVPASGKSGGLLPFAILWCSFTGVMTFLFFVLPSKSPSSGNPPPVGILLAFFSLFWAVGLGMLYAGCRNKFARLHLSAAQGGLTLRRELFGRSSQKSLPAGTIQSVEQTQFYQKNYQPVMGIEVRASHGKLRFGSVLSEDEKAWLVADLRRVLLGIVPQAAVAAPTHAVTRQGAFSMTLPANRKHLWGLAIVLTLFGSGFAIVGGKLIQPGGGGAGPSTGFPASLFDLLHSGFGTLWLLMSFLTALAGVALMVWLNRVKNQETRVEGTDAEIAIRTYRHHLVLKETLLPRASVTDVRTSNSGSSNGKPMKRIELIADGRAYPLARWMDGGQADEFAASLRAVLF